MIILIQIVANVVVQLIILLYLIDNNEQTSWMILMGSGIGVVIEAWKVSAKVDVRLQFAQALAHRSPRRLTSVWYLPQPALGCHTRLTSKVSKLAKGLSKRPSDWQSCRQTCTKRRREEDARVSFLRPCVLHLCNTLT